MPVFFGRALPFLSSASVMMLTVLSDLAAGAVFRNVEMPCHVERRGLAGGERTREIDFHHGPVDARLRRGPGRSGHLIEPIERRPALEVARAKARVGRKDKRV